MHNQMTNAKISNKQFFLTNGNKKRSLKKYFPALYMNKKLRLLQYLFYFLWEEHIF